MHRLARRSITTIVGLTIALSAPALAFRFDGTDAPAFGESDDVARAALVEHLQRSPNDPVGHLRLGELLLEAGEKDAAAHHLELAGELYLAAGSRKAARAKSE